MSEDHSDETNGEAPRCADSAEMTLELYKSLLSESATYRQKLGTLWFQKFGLLGGVIVFILAKGGGGMVANSAFGNQLLVLAVASIPILAFLIDCKIFEYALQSKIISKFVVENLTNHPIVVGWEFALWGGRFNSLVWWRSIITVAVTAVPTLVILYLASRIVTIVDASLGQYASFVFYLGVFVYFIGALLFLPQLLAGDDSVEGDE